MKPRKLSSIKLSIPLASAIATLLCAQSIQAQLYYKSPTAANVWTGSFWGSDIAGPYNTAWVNNSHVVFLDNGGTALALTGATTNFASITANENVNVTASGTLGTNGTVATLTVASGKNLNFGTQAISTAAGTGFIKAGDGIVTIAGGTYAGGFTLNAGTVALSGFNGMGDGGTLTINGGTIRSNSTTARDLSNKYDTGIVIGGNFALGDATNNGALTFNNTVALGAANRNITVNSAATFGGIVSATGAFGFTKLGVGDLRLDAANTFTGALNVNEGTVTIGNYTGLASAVNLEIGSTGILRYVVVGTGGTTDSNSNALSLNGGILRTAGGSASNTIALTWSGNTTLTANSTINSHGNGIFDFDGAIDLGANGLTFQTDASFNSNRIDGVISGSGGSLNKTGVSGSTLILGNANTFTGGTTISTGVLSLANVNALQNTSGITIGGASAATLSATTSGITLSAPITTANTGITSTITFANASGGNISLNGAIGGNGNVAYSTPNLSSGGNTNTINLGTAGAYAGSTSINTGNINNNLVLRNASASANVIPTSTVLNFGTGAGPVSAVRTTTLDLNGQNQTLAGLGSPAAVAVPNGRNHRVSSAAAATLTINSTADQTFGGTTVAGSLTTSAQIAGAISLVKNGAGTFTLGGLLTGIGATASGNSFNGSTTVLGGILVLGETTSIQNSAYDTTASVAGTSTSGLRTTVTTLTLGGLTGGNDFSTRFTSTSGGYTGLTALTLNPGTGVTNSYSGDVGNGNGSMTLTKSGLGTQTLSGANAYTGATNINAGTLRINGSTSTSSAFVVAAAGALAGNGTVGGTVALSGIVAPGASTSDIDTLNVGTSTINAGSVFQFNLASSGNTADKLNITGDFNKGSAGTYQFDFMSSTPSAGEVFTLATWSGSTTFVAADFSFTGLAPAFEGSSFSISGSNLNWTAVPEASNLLVGGLIGLGLMSRRRKQA